VQKNYIPSIDGFQDIFVLILKSTELQQEMRWIDALKCIDKAISINPKLLLCQVNRAMLLYEMKHYEEALESLDIYLQHMPLSPEIMLLKQEIFDKALNEFNQLLSEQPENVSVLLQRGNLLKRSGQYEQALVDYATILHINPFNADACNNQGNIFVELGSYEKAIKSYNLAITCDNNANTWYNLGNTYQFLGHFEAAKLAYQHAIELKPDFAEAQLEISHCLMRAGNYTQAWPLFEWRWNTKQLKNYYLQTNQPIWLGGKLIPEGINQLHTINREQLAGKTLLIWAEQGMGDTTMFLRFVPKLLSDAGKIVLRVQSKLLNLIQEFDDRIMVIGDDEPLPEYDAHCPLMSLPFVLGESVLEQSSPYLYANRSDVEYWGGLLGKKQKLRVGLVWAGRQYGVINTTRDIPLSLLTPLTQVNVDLFSLQKDISSTDFNILQEFTDIHCYDSLLNDFSDTAALIECLDIVISVDTAIAHLTCALGKTCWLMLRYSGEWRWLSKRSDSPWYPTMRIFRQPAPGNWEAVVSDVAYSLSALTR
jgi:tetratricopeptide (TPR) repeat protein